MLGGQPLLYRASIIAQVAFDDDLHHVVTVYPQPPIHSLGRLGVPRCMSSYRYNTMYDWCMFIQQRSQSNAISITEFVNSFLYII